MVKDFTTMIRDPLYAAGIAALITVVAKWFDNRLSDEKSSVVDYLKSALFNAALVGAWVWLLRNPAELRKVTNDLMSEVTVPSIGEF